MNVPLRYYEIADSTHRIINPLSAAMLSTLAETIELRPGQRMLDLACGRGEVICRWAHDHGIGGQGVDVHVGLLADATARAKELGVADRVAFVQSDAAEFRPEPSAFHVVSCMGATWIGGGQIGTINLMKPAVSEGGLILLGDAYWKRPPTDAAIEARACDPDDFTTLDGMLGRFEQTGTELVGMALSTEADFERFVAQRWWNMARWAADNLDDPDRDGLLSYLDSYRRGYLAHLRDYLSWGVFVLAVSH